MKYAMAALLIAALAGCDEGGRSRGPIRVPEPPKPPAVKKVVAPKPRQPLQVKPVESPTALRPLELRPANGPKLVRPNTLRPEPATPYSPGSGQAPFRAADPRQAAAQHLLLQGAK